jgi:predicted dehydrogenase
MSRTGRLEPLKLGIVGCGFVTERRHLPTLQRLSEVRVVALADVDSDKCERVAARFGRPSCHPDVRALLANADVDAVAVCTPASTHTEVALPALDAGKHVFVEKPITLSLEEAGTLVRRAQNLSATTTVGFNQRHHRLVREARKLLRDGAVGRVTAIATRFTDARLAQPDLPAWRSRRETGGGGLLEKLIHHFDLWRFLLDDEVEDVFADSRGSRSDDETTLVTGRMSKGALAHAFGSDLSTSSNEALVYGEKGSILVDLYRFDGLIFSGMLDLPGAPLTRLRRLATGAAQLSRSLGELRSGGLFNASYAAEWRCFAAAARGSRPPGSTFEDGLRALEITFAAAQSASLGRRIKVADAPSSVPPAEGVPI